MALDVRVIGPEERNTRTAQTLVVARSTQEAIVVAVEGHPHRPAHAS